MLIESDSWKIHLQQLTYADKASWASTLGTHLSSFKFNIVALISTRDSKTFFSLFPGASSYLPPKLGPPSVNPHALVPCLRMKTGPADSILSAFSGKSIFLWEATPLSLHPYHGYSSFLSIFPELVSEVITWPRTGQSKCSLTLVIGII